MKSIRFTDQHKAPIIVLLILLINLSITPHHAFLLPKTTLQPHTCFLRSSSSPSSSFPDSMGGVNEFETWWSSFSSSSDDLPVRHALFQKGQLRGLEVLDRTKQSLIVPKRVVLRTSYQEEHWDVNLALMLLRECLLGSKSELYGYTSLLTLNQQPFPERPPSTAPDALRHWTTEQKSILNSSPSGQKLLRLEQSQTQKWNQKYDTRLDIQSDISKEQFLWAMEAVHSRAFKGQFQSDILPNAIRIVIPILASVVGYNSLMDPFMEYNDVVALGCGIVAVLPFFLFKKEEDAVLLPLIDSANHSEMADSSIDYDPLKGDIVLTVGDNCFVEEEDDGEGKKTQLYISYGKKNDVELLLNYGFLGGVEYDEMEDGLEEESRRDGRRRRLAEEFLRRNS